MTTATDTSLDLIQALDFDPACEAKEPCIDPAKWICVFDCCGNDAALCHDHKASKEVQLDGFAADPRLRMRCTRCHNTVKRDQIRFEPIGGR